MVSTKQIVEWTTKSSWFIFLFFFIWMLSNLAFPGHFHGGPLLQSSNTDRTGPFSRLFGSSCNKLGQKEHTNEAHIQTNIHYTPCSSLLGLNRVGEWPGSALFWALLLLRNMIRQLTIGARKQILQITSILYRFIYECDWLNKGPGSNHVIGLTVIFPDLTCVQGLICLYEIIFYAYIWYQKSSLS